MNPRQLVSFVVLLGAILDRTTGQPLTGVDVRATAGKTSAHAVTDANGRFTLRGLPAGAAAVTVQSDDVPPQRFTVTVKSAATQHVELRACSTTLDYSCANSQY
jgi:hypothetical protein